MELPPSGWYPDPYGMPGLLRWWDGATWTHHTHAAGGTGVTDSADSGTRNGSGPQGGASAQQTAVQPGVQATTVQPGVQPTRVQPSVQQTSVQPTTVRPGVQPTAYQQAATPVQPTTVQPTTVQPTTVQPTTVQPATPGPDANGTQVLFLGDDAWSTGGPGGPDQGDRFGYLRAQRRRRMWLMAGLAGGTAVVLLIIALVVNSLGNSHPSVQASKTPTKPAAITPASPAPSPTPSATAAVITDGASGFSYTQLSSWQPGCPAGLTNQSFTWTAGESAVAGQVNGGQTTWYGAACSGPLPQAYGYHSVADLENTATNLVNSFNNTYYGALQHGFQQEYSGPTTISGHPGWEIKYLISYQNVQGEGLPFTEEQGTVVIADLGTAAPAVFFASVPSNLNETNVGSLLSSLQLTVPAQPGGGGSPGDGSPTAGSPAPGGGDGNGGGGN